MFKPLNLLLPNSIMDSLALRKMTTAMMTLRNVTSQNGKNKDNFLTSIISQKMKLHLKLTFIRHLDRDKSLCFIVHQTIGFSIACLSASLY